MSDLSNPTNSDTSPELYKIIEAVHQVKITNESDCSALKCFIDKISDVTTLRTKRISLSNEQLPPRLNSLILIMSFILVLGFILMAVSNFWIHLFMVFSVIISIYLIHMVLTDLNHPFFGIWNINDEPFKELEEKLKKQ